MEVCDSALGERARLVRVKLAVILAVADVPFFAVYASHDSLGILEE